jgi:phage terminase large subunit
VEITVDTTVTFENILNSTHKVVHNIGGTRSSKSYSCMQYCIVQALQQPHIVTVVRKTVPSLKRTIMKDFKDIMKTIGIWDSESFNITDRVYTFSNGSVIQFVSTDDAEKLRGIKSDILFIDEANEIDEESYFQLSIRTAYKILLAYNPTVSPYSWLRQMDECDRYVTTYKDNPYLDKSIIKGIEDLQHKNEKYWKIYGLGEFAPNDKAIYNFQIVDEMPVCELVGFGMDFGFSNDPTALIAVHKQGDMLYLRELMYETGLVTKDILDRLSTLNIDPSEEIWCDSAEPRLIEEIYRGGFNAKPVKKGPDSIRFGISVLQNYGLAVEKKSQNLINELYSYEYITDKYGYVTDRPQDMMNHLMDAMRYVALSKLSIKQQQKGKYAISIK